QVFVQVYEGKNMQEVSGIIKNAKYDNITGEYRKTKPEIFLHPMSKWYLHSEFENGVISGGRIELVWLFGLIGVFTLLLACINFMNLATARSMKRSKEVGIRKTIGSLRQQLIFQFFGESLLVVVLSFLVALGVTVLLLPFFNELTDKTMIFPWANTYFWGLALLFILITAIISGSYPALYLSSFKPSRVLKGTLGNNKGTGNLRKALVVFQFAISIALIVATITVYNQIQYAKERAVGYNVENLIYVPINTAGVIEKFEPLREELLSSGAIEEVAASDVRITGTFTTNSGFDWKGKDPGMSEEFRTLRATHGYGEMVDWEIKEGRDFSRQFKSDSLAFILNETAVRYMGFENPVGEIIRWGDNGLYKVVGVVKDMVTTSPFDQVRPSLYILHYGRFLNMVNIKIADKSDMKSALAHIEKVFKKYDPKSLFSYNFFEDDYQGKFIQEERIGTLASLFAALAILISCLGIFGLSAFMAEQRTKELGVRKVLGASMYNLLGLLTKDFFILVIVACCIAIPTGLYYMDNWLQKYEYRTVVEWWVPVLTIFVILSITLITISFQTVKASLTNPVKSLRTE
ncbi:MAG: ABC transporter permease, partial [Flavobacteriaceae bacterium]